MSSELEPFLAFLDEQTRKHAPHFPTLKVDKVLAFMGTTSMPGTWAACSVNRLHGVQRGATGGDLRITLSGPLARTPTRGECISVHMTRVERYQGFQVKTRALGAGGAPESELLEAAPGGLVVKGS